MVDDDRLRTEDARQVSSGGETGCLPAATARYTALAALPDQLGHAAYRRCRTASIPNPRRCSKGSQGVFVRRFFVLRDLRLPPP